MLRAGSSLLLLVGLSPLAAPPGRVLVVSSAFGPFFDIQSAVTAAADGATVLVESGSYAGFTVDDKALNVVADTGSSVHVTGRITIQNLAAGRSVVLAGLTVAPPGAPTADALALANDRGSVRIESCDFNGFHAHGGHGASVVNSKDVTFAFSHVTSGAADSFSVGAAGLSASASRLAVYDCESHGGSGSFGCPQGFTGGNGIDLASSFLFASRCRSYGGTGGRGDTGGFGCVCGADGGPGGNGLHIGGSPTATLLAGRYLGGDGGAGDCGYCGGCGGTDGWTGLAISGGPPVVLPGEGRVLEVLNPVRELATFPVTVRGVPGDRVWLFVSRDTVFRVLPADGGVLLVAAPQSKILLGTIGPSGAISTTLSFPDLGAGVESRNEYLQAAVRDAGGSWVLTGVSSLVVLDQAF